MIFCMGFFRSWNLLQAKLKNELNPRTIFIDKTVSILSCNNRYITVNESSRPWQRRFSLNNLENYGPLVPR